MPQKPTLQQAREAAGLNIEALARATLTESGTGRIVKVWPKTIRYIEAGEHSPTARTRHRLASALGLTPDAIAWPGPETCETCGRLLPTDRADD